MCSGLGRFERVEAEQLKELADLVPELRWVPHPDGVVDLVGVPTADLDPGEEACFDEVGDDSLSCSLRDPDRFGDIAQSGIRVAGDAEQHLGVVGDESPGFALLPT